MIDPPEDLAFAPLHWLRNRIASGRLSPVALAETLLERIERLDSTLHAFVEVYRDEALEAARGLAALQRSGTLLGPMHGIPIAIKDLCDISGKRTTFGSATWPVQVAAADSTAVERLRRAGAVIIGKTHLVEFAFGGWGTNTTMGTPRNPWDSAVYRVPGGSSSGSAVAVAAGLAPAAIGSDTGGSIRIPSSFCGLVGLKTTVGRVSNHGVAPLAASLDTLGPMTRSVEDAALVFEVLAGPDPRDPATRGLEPAEPLSGLKSGIAGLRLAVMSGADRADADGEVLAAYDAALETMERLGAELVRVMLPMTCRDYQAMTTPIMMAEGYAVHRGRIEREDLVVDPAVRARILGGKAIRASEYLNDLSQQRAAQRDYLAALAGAGAVALLLPSTPHPAPPVESVDQSSLSVSRYTRLCNYLGLCGLSLPSGISATGTPLSLQVVGRPHDEALILRIGWAFEAATPWHLRHPEL
jgi:aspartyl-tRNA(Asn)/glutamyl-tRNA(Gln) amidotransferase subunit A